MKKLILTLVVLSTLISCGRFGNEDKKADHKERIVSAAKQYTEIMYALGANDDLVAVDISSTYPSEAQELPTIGYHMHLSLESIVSAKPTMLLHKGGSYSIGPEQVVRQLEQLNIPLKSFETEATDIPSTKKLIREMGTYFKQEKAADSLCTKLEQDMATALESTKEKKDKPKVVVIHFGQAMNIYMAIGKNSTAGQMVAWAGGEIPIDKNGMERITSPEMIAKANPDVILLTDFGYDRMGSVEKIKELPGVALTDAAKNNHIYRVNEHDLIYLGPRTGENVLLLQKLIHKDEPAL